VCVICAFFLAFVYGVAKDKIEINAKKRMEDAISSLAPEAATIKKIEAGTGIIYQLIDAKNDLIGYTFLAEGQGYQGKIKILAAIDPSLEYLKGIEIIELIETPGLGAKIQDIPFRKQFNELKVSPSIECLKGDSTRNNQVKAITGATVSSRAVVNILNKRIEELRKTNIP